jgi:hypothetical protein
MALKGLNFGDLSIAVKNEGEDLILNWKGAIYERNPEEYLDPFLKGVIKHAEENSFNIKCYFDKLEYMNSTSILSLIQLMRDFSDKKIQGEFIYDQSRKIQVASFRALDVIARTSNYITLKGI